MQSVLQRARAIIASASRLPTSTPSSAASLHTTPALYESARQRASRLARQRNKTRRAELSEHARTHAPHLALGTRPGEEHKWEQCDLARCIALPTEERTRSPLGWSIDVPGTLAHGVGPAEEALLFDHLPLGSADAQLAAATKLASRGARGSQGSQPQSQAPVADIAGSYGFYFRRAATGAQNVANVLDVRNVDAGGRAFVHRMRIVREFSSDPEKPQPTTPEVQAALLTYKIRNVWEHLSRAPRDIANRRGLRALVHQRAKVLRFLKRQDRERYNTLLARIGVEPGAVEGELVI